jgi:hypothetical protein
VSFSYLCDPKIRESLRASGDDPAALPRVYADAINGALAGCPADMTRVRRSRRTRLPRTES